jgi:glutaredoxin-related protein
MSGMFRFLSDQESEFFEENSNESNINQNFLEDIKKYAEFGLFPTVYVNTDLNPE